MNYELDFIGVSEQTKDADAIGIHWIDNDVHTIKSHHITYLTIYILE